MFTKRTIDHLVYTVHDLEAGMDWCEEKMGIRPNVGGRHQTQGTKNAVLNLGNGCYLEIIATDPANDEHTGPRWMGVDLIDQPKLTRWALKSSDLSADSQVLQNFNTELGIVKSGQRTLGNGNLLTWQMIMPLAAPEVDVIPFMVDWDSSDVHPTENMPDVCQLIGMEFKHPKPESLAKTMEGLALDLTIAKAAPASIVAIIKTPLGIVTI